MRFHHFFLCTMSSQFSSSFLSLQVRDINEQYKKLAEVRRQRFRLDKFTLLRLGFFILIWNSSSRRHLFNAIMQHNDVCADVFIHPRRYRIPRSILLKNGKCVWMGGCPRLPFEMLNNADTNCRPWGGGNMCKSHPSRLFFFLACLFGQRVYLNFVLYEAWQCWTVKIPTLLWFWLNGVSRPSQFKKKKVICCWCLLVE